MSKERKVLHRVLANAGTLLGGRTVNALVGLSYIALTARGLGKELMGVIVLINAFSQFLGDVARFQSWQTLLQYGAGFLLQGDRPRFQQVLRFTLLLDVIGAMVGVSLGVCGALLLGSHLGWPADLSPAAATYALSIAVMESATSVGLLRLFDRFRFLAAEQAVSSAVRLLGCGLAFLSHAPAVERGTGLRGLLKRSGDPWSLMGPARRWLGWGSNVGDLSRRPPRSRRRFGLETGPDRCPARR